MKKINRLSVLFDNGTTKRLVGTLALYKERYTAFAYTDEWLETGFSISPFSLPLKKKVFIPEWKPFGGVHGIFNDSLPDGWGRILIDRMLMKLNVRPENFLLMICTIFFSYLSKLN